MSTTTIPPRDPVLTFGSADPLVPGLCRVLDALGYDVGPLGTADLSAKVMEAVNRFRADRDVVEDRADLPAETDPTSVIAAATWAAVHQAAKDAHLFGVDHDQAGQVNTRAKAAAARATTTKKRRLRK